MTRRTERVASELRASLARLLSRDLEPVAQGRHRHGVGGISRDGGLEIVLGLGQGVVGCGADQGDPVGAGDAAISAEHLSALVAGGELAKHVFAKLDQLVVGLDCRERHGSVLLCDGAETCQRRPRLGDAKALEKIASSEPSVAVGGTSAVPVAFVREGGILTTVLGARC